VGLYSISFQKNKTKLQKKQYQAKSIFYIIIIFYQIIPVFDQLLFLNIYRFHIIHNQKQSPQIIDYLHSVSCFFL